MSEQTLDEYTRCGIPAIRVLARELVALRDATTASIKDHGTVLNSLYSAGSECEAEFRKRLDDLEAGGALRPTVSAAEVILQEEIARLRSARDEYARGHREVCDINERLIVAHNAERERLRAALAKYGGHVGPCTKWSTPQLACTCGLADALEAPADIVRCVHCDLLRDDCEPQPSGELVCADCVINALERADEARHT
jgi:hypothetical protein